MATLTAIRATDARDPVALRVVATRAPHALNDQRVGIRDGARGTTLRKDGADALGGRGLVGYVWAVADGRAVVDFGLASDGQGVRVVVALDDLVACDAE